MDESTDRMVDALNRIADEIAAHLAWMREQKTKEDAQRTQLPPNDYTPSPLLAGRWPRRDGNTYPPVQKSFEREGYAEFERGNTQTGDL